MADIFISYAREDEQRIRDLADALKKQSWSIFWDRRIPAGQTWHSYIGRALSEAKCVIVAWSRYSIASRWVIEEAEEGQHRHILVPVLLEFIQPPMGFRSIQAADLTTWQPGSPSPHLDQLIEDIIVVIGEKPKPNMITDEPAPNTEQKADARLRHLKINYRLFTYALVAILLALIGTGFWSYRVWLTPSTGEKKLQQMPAYQTPEQIRLKWSSQYKVILNTLGISEEEFKQLYNAVLSYGFIKDELSAAWQQDQPWLAKESTVLYYDDANIGKARELAELMEKLTGDKYAINRGGGYGIDPQEYKIRLVVHYIKH